MNSSYCTMAWNSIHYDANGRVAPCCQFRGQEENIFNLTADEYFASDWLKDIKEKMLAGIKIKYKDGTVKDITDASDNLNVSALAKPVTKYYLFAPYF